MDFAISDRARQLRDVARAFVDQELLPHEHSLRSFGFKAMYEQLESQRRLARDLGLFAPHMPEEFGGLGLGVLEQALLSEVLGEALAGHYTCNFQAPDVGNMELLHHAATERQRERWLLPLCRGEVRSTFLMTEPDRAGSNPVWMDTAATLRGEDWVIHGHKWFATAADGAAFAVVMAVTDPSAPSAHERASMFLVPTDTPGFDVVRNISIMGHEGQGWMSHSEVMLDNVVVPQSALIGERGGGFRLAQRRLGPGRIHHASRWLGVCNRALRLMCERAKARELAPGRALSSAQQVQVWIAESRAEIEAARLLVLQTAWQIDEGLPHREGVSLIKFYVAGVMQRVIDRALQVHGALGMSDDTPLALWYAHERAARIYDGPDEVHKVVVAKSVLKTVV